MAECSTRRALLSIGTPIGISLLALGLTIVILFLDLFVTPDLELALLYGVVVVVVSLTRSVRLVLTSCLGCVALIFAAALVWPPGVSWLGRLPSLGLAASSVLLVGGVLVHRLRVEAARDRALADRLEALEQLKVLQGLLRVCAWCRRIHDDEDRWMMIEEYVASHSEAAFTHGICPDCLSQAADGASKTVAGDPPAPTGCCRDVRASLPVAVPN